MWSGLIWCVWYVIDWTGIVGYDMVWSDVVWSGLLQEQQAQVCLQPLTHIFREMSVLILPIIRVFNPALLQVEALYCTVGPFECVFWLALGLMWAVQTWLLLLWYFNTSLLKTHHDPCIYVCVCVFLATGLILGSPAVLDSLSLTLRQLLMLPSDRIQEADSAQTHGPLCLPLRLTLSLSLSLSFSCVSHEGQITLDSGVSAGFCVFF